jgi:2,4-diaminopentanoate dehydrogenase
MPLRVIQWATGSVGRAAIEAVRAHPDLTLVGCRVHSATKDGADAGELAGGGPLGVRATRDDDEILRLEADAVVYAPLLPDEREVEALLRSGKNVVTPVGWFYPDPARPDRVARLVAACEEGGVTLHGTGIDPGGVTEIFPLMISAMSSAVTSVRGEEFSDIRSYDAPDVVRDVMGFGGTREQAIAGPMVKLLDGGFRQSVAMVLDGLGFDPARRPAVRRTHDVGLATAAIALPIGDIAPGRVAAQRFRWEAVAGDEVVVRVGVTWLMGEENLEDGWTLGPDGERFEIEVRGEPDAVVTIRGWQARSVSAGLLRNPGILATAAHCVNSIPYVCAAAPGVRTSLDLPIVTGRAHPRLLGAGRQAPGTVAP